MPDMQYPAPAPQQQKPAPWRPLALAAAAVGLGGALLAFGAHQSTPAQAPQPQPVAQQALPVIAEPLSLSMLPPQDAAHAIARSAFSNEDKTALLAAVREHRIRLATLPLADASGQTGQSVTVSGAGFSQHVVLGARPVAVLLPIAKSAIITLTRTSPAEREPLSIATLDMFHSVIVLPALTAASPAFAAPVIVQ